MRGFKRDLQATADAYRLGTLVDKKGRSFISLPVTAIASHGPDHMILYGLDVVNAREMAVQRAAGQSGTVHCQKCWKPVTDYVHELDPHKMEMHHLDRKHRCWCPHNLEIWCHGCHFAADGPHPSRKA